MLIIKFLKKDTFYYAIKKLNQNALYLLITLVLLQSTPIKKISVKL